MARSIRPTRLSGKSRADRRPTCKPMGTTMGAWIKLIMTCGGHISGRGSAQIKMTGLERSALFCRGGPGDGPARWACIRFFRNSLAGQCNHGTARRFVPRQLLKSPRECDARHGTIDNRVFAEGKTVLGEFNRPRTRQFDNSIYGGKLMALGPRRRGLSMRRFGLFCPHAFDIVFALRHYR